MPTWGDSSHVNSYMPSSENEKQVYLQGYKTRMLTTRRLIEISQMRPIDKLYNLLINMLKVDSKRSLINNTDLLDFAHMYSMEETCAMLLQVIVDRQAQYQVSQRME